MIFGGLCAGSGIYLLCTRMGMCVFVLGGVFPVSGDIGFELSHCMRPRSPLVFSPELPINQQKSPFIFRDGCFYEVWGRGVWGMCLLQIGAVVASQGGSGENLELVTETYFV